jgi:hypothetical protein
VLLQVGDCGCYFCLPLNLIVAPSGGLCHGTLLHNHQCDLLTTKTMELKFVFEVEIEHVISHSCILMLDVYIMLCDLFVQTFVNHCGVGGF